MNFTVIIEIESIVTECYKDYSKTHFRAHNKTLLVLSKVINCCLAHDGYIIITFTKSYCDYFI